MSKRVSVQMGIVAEADGIEDLDDEKASMSVKLKRNRHTAQNEI